MVKDRKRYFTDPLQILYMMREFNVAFDKVIGVQVKDLILADLLCTNMVIKAYVDPRSESIFEPQDGDEGISKNARDTIARFRGHSWWFRDGDDTQSDYPENGTIISRNDKPFFRGELETI